LQHSETGHVTSRPQTLATSH